MAFHLIDMETWERRDHYRYYQTLVRTGYTLTTEIDITCLLEEVRRRELRFLEESVQPDERCRGCAHFALCRGGCRRYREPRVNGRLGRNVFCAAYEQFFAYAGRRIDRLAARFVRLL